MEHHKTSKLLNDSAVSKLVTIKWIEINNLSGGQFSVKKNVRFKTSILRSDLCDYSDAYIVVKGRISVIGNNNANKRNKKLNFKNNALFTSCISKIDNTFVGNAEDFDIVMMMYNLLEYSDNYFMTSGSLWNYYRDEVNGAVNEIVDNRRINNSREQQVDILNIKQK